MAICDTCAIIYVPYMMIRTLTQTPNCTAYEHPRLNVCVLCAHYTPTTPIDIDPIPGTDPTYVALSLYILLFICIYVKL